MESNNAGFSLIEMMIVVAIVGVLVSIAMPSFSKMLERNRLKEATEALKMDLMLARTEAIKQSINLNVSIKTNGSAWCYGIDNDNTSCDCSVAGDCALKTVDGNQFNGIALMSSDVDIAFDYRRGTASPQSVILDTTHYQTKIIVSNGGRVRVCSFNSAKAIGSYDGC